MSVPMALGPFIFESLVSGYSGLNRDLGTRWAEIQTVGGLNQLQWTGGDGDSITIDGVVFPEEFGGLVMLEGLRAAAQSGQVLPLVTLQSGVYGFHIVEGVSEDQSFHTALGLPRKDAYRLYLRRTQINPQSFLPLSVLTTLVA